MGGPDINREQLFARLHALEQAQEEHTKALSDCLAEINTVKKELEEIKAKEKASHKK
jgi:arginine deiminase